MFAKLNNAVACVLMVLGLLACDRNTGPVPLDQHPQAAFIVELSLASTEPVSTNPRTTLFYGARPAVGGPPVYIARRQNVRFPGVFYLTEENRMNMGADYSGPLVLFARLDGDGNATTIDPSDWTGLTTQPVLPGNTKVSLQLSQAGSPPPPWQIQVTIGPAPVPPETTTYVLLREVGGRVPLAALKVESLSFPVTVTLMAQHLLAEPPASLANLEVLVKVDGDGNPQTTQAGDYYAITAAAAQVQVQLQPDPRLTP